MRKKVRYFALFGVFAVAAAIAKMWGPFLMRPYFPDVDFQYDSETTFAHAGNVPREILNTSVQQIKSGDTIRMVYPNGDVYDFETTTQCSFARGISCTLTNPIRKAAPDAQAKPSSYEVRQMRDDTCPWDSRSVSFKTGFWTHITEYIGALVRVRALWQDTGTVDVYIKGSGCK